MTSEFILKLIGQGEGISVEFKKAREALPENFFETVCAFLNRNGGHILLGINDDKSVEGVNPEKAEAICKNIANLSNNSQKVYPTFLLSANCISYKEKIIIHVFIPISSQVHSSKNVIFDRSEDGDYKLITSEQIKNCYTRKTAYYSENTIYPYLDPSDFAEGIVDRVRKIIGIQRPDHPWNELSDNEFYSVAGLYRKDAASGLEGFTMSSLLLFGKPQVISSAIPHYKIDALVRIKDTNRYDDRINIRCNLVEAYDLLMQFVQKHLPDKFFLEKDQRISLRDVIFREVIANLIVHREYTNAFPSTFIIYADKVEIKNANKPHFYGQLVPTAFEPFPKNPHIAQLFTQMGRCEELGTGIKQVCKYSIHYSGSEEIEFIEKDVFVTIIPLRKKKLSDNDTDNDTNNDTDNDTDDRLKKILALMKENHSITTKNLSELLNITQITVKRDIEKLKKEGKLKRVGSTKAGRWELIPDEIRE